jgi:metallo-beta-lactamase class B
MRRRKRSGAWSSLFPGAGHTVDNIVVYEPRTRTLFGGCLIKSSTAVDLGNVADAKVPVWVPSVRSVQARYPQSVNCVPGHGTIAGDDLAQTLKLAGAAAKPS